MAYVLDHVEVFRLSDVTDANGQRVITYEQRELWVQASPPDSYWVVPATCRWQLVGGGSTHFPYSILRPVEYLLPFSGARTVSNPVPCVAVAQGTQTVQFPDATVPVSGNFVETVAAFGPFAASDVGQPARYEGTSAHQRHHDFMGEEAPEPSPPVVTLVSPAEGAIDADTPIVIDVTDADGFACLLIVAEMPGVEIADLVHDGSEFKPAYAENSTRTPIDGGWRYTILRRSAWPASPTITAHPVDVLGAASEE